MLRYSHLFFDLDRTLWDFESNSKEALKDIFKEFHLNRFFHNTDYFIETYKDYNRRCWDLYLAGETTKAWLVLHRFLDPLAHQGHKNEELAMQLSDSYLYHLETKTTMFPHALEILDYLSRKYKLHIITNGFAQTQYNKLKNCNLRHYFTTITTSEEAGYHKPRPEIFARALSSANAKKVESLMIGDDWESDVMGACNFGLDQVFFNPLKLPVPSKITFVIESLDELKKIL